MMNHECQTAINSVSESDLSMLNEYIIITLVKWVFPNKNDNILHSQYLNISERFVNCTLRMLKNM